MVPTTNKFFVETISTNNTLFVGMAPTNNRLFVRMVPQNNKLFVGLIRGVNTPVPFEDKSGMKSDGSYRTIRDFRLKKSGIGAHYCRFTQQAMSSRAQAGYCRKPKDILDN